MNKNTNHSIERLLNDEPQMLPTKNGFDVIMDQLHQQKRSRSFKLPAIAAVVLAAVLLWQLPKINSAQQLNEQFQQLDLLTEKIAMIESVVRSDVVNHSAPGSQILEKMISMENWLDQLDKNIAQSDDPKQKLELLYAKLEILDDIVTLQKKYKPQNTSQLI